MREREREVTDRGSISQNVRLLGCVCKTLYSTRLVAPTNKNLRKGKRYNDVCNIAALVKPVPGVHPPGPTDLKTKRGDHFLCSYWAHIEDGL
jgi:hypothetical protein